MKEFNIPATTHGRYLVVPAHRASSRILTSFHGYAESAETALARLQSIDGSGEWILLSVQGLHAFYRGRSNDVAASWMTRQNRELAISDNCRYVAAIVSAVAAELTEPGIVFTGFSQGVAMAFRAAATSVIPVLGVIACGGDVPPELDHVALRAARRVLIGRGAHDDWYTPEKCSADEARLKPAGVRVSVDVFNDGHVWPPEFSAACAGFLRDLI